VQHERERPDMERKYMNINKAQSKKLELTNLINEVGGSTNILYKASKLALYIVNRNRRLGVSPRSPESPLGEIETLL